MIVDDVDGWQIFLDRLAIAVAHINGNGLESRCLASDFLEERGDISNRPAFNGAENPAFALIDEDRHVRVPFTDAEFINAEISLVAGHERQSWSPCIARASATESMEHKIEQTAHPTDERQKQQACFSTAEAMLPGTAIGATVCSISHFCFECNRVALIS